MLIIEMWKMFYFFKKQDLLQNNSYVFSLEPPLDKKK